MIQSLTQSQIEVYDELNIRNNQEIRNFFDADEKILYSGMLKKVNKHGNSQERMLVVTSKSIYNIAPNDNPLTKLAFWLAPQTAIRRKIQIKKISAITITTYHLSDEFVIHVNDEYDYRFQGQGKRDKIIKLIAHAFFKTGGKSIPFFIKEDTDLSKYTTHDTDVKSGINKRPTDGKINLTYDLLEKGLVWIIQNKKDLISQAILSNSVNTSNINMNSQFGMGGNVQISQNNMNPYQMNQGNSNFQMNSNIQKPQNSQFNSNPYQQNNYQQNPYYNQPSMNQNSQVNTTFNKQNTINKIEDIKLTTSVQTNNQNTNMTMQNNTNSSYQNNPYGYNNNTNIQASIGIIPNNNVNQNVNSNFNPNYNQNTNKSPYSNNVNSTNTTSVYTNNVNVNANTTNSAYTNNVKPNTTYNNQPNNGPSNTNNPNMYKDQPSYNPNLFAPIESNVNYNVQISTNFETLLTDNYANQPNNNFNKVNHQSHLPN